MLCPAADPLKWCRVHPGRVRYGERMRRLGRINVTPVKAMALAHPPAVRLAGSGIPGNRLFYLVDDSGAMMNASDLRPLVQVQPTYDPVRERLVLLFPDGTVVDGDAAALGGPERTDFYGREVPSHHVEGPFDDALSAYIRKHVRLLRCDRDGDGNDEMPLTIVSSASVADLGRRGGHRGPLDGRRFRINLELDGCDPYDEDAWDGRDVAIGNAVVTIAGAIPRCVVTTLDPNTGSKDWDTLTQIAKYRPRIGGDGGLPFGMYATTRTAAEVREGDAVEPL
jgi:uncharacterized protein